eukprot:CAMPEP_0206142886 /NCGR_PEP_ID=MMETSP1473-20131121/18540_1 /ASSEMBLY_ACC=CAM_ASM_001109 /TAXON_ID=1461547 /ORGANISM="Stichococcus sp, Strain RCC1054" /LENGTH=98 /DNA_ID=CAMNT_0053538049 /DNA_START=271 /DNA_END=564 /DNA_ORIENTATION=+
MPTTEHMSRLWGQSHKGLGARHCDLRSHHHAAGGAMLGSPRVFVSNWSGHLISNQAALNAQSRTAQALPAWAAISPSATPSPVFQGLASQQAIEAKGG